MSKNEKLQENIKLAIKDAECELQDYPVMPEHYSTI